MKNKLFLMWLAFFASALTAVSYSQNKQQNIDPQELYAYFSQQMKMTEQELDALDVFLTSEEEDYITAYGQAYALKIFSQYGKEWKLDVKDIERESAIALAEADLIKVKLDGQKAEVAEAYNRLCIFWAAKEVLRIYIDSPKNAEAFVLGDPPTLIDYD